MQNLSDPPGAGGLTPADLAALREAVELTTAVVRRHHMQMTGPMATALAVIRRDVAILTGPLEAATS
jgi:hypothetical protein